MAEKHIIKYPNGATFIYYQQNVNSTTNATIGFICGASQDGKKKGLAHAVEHCLFHGIPGMTTEEIDEFMHINAIHHNAFTNQDCIAIDFDVPNTNFAEAMKINSDMLAKTDFDEKMWDDEREVILQEKYVRSDAQKGRRVNAFSYIYDTSTYGSDEIIGNEKTLYSITIDDLKNYRDKNFVTQNLIVSIVSSLPYEVVKSYAEEYYINRFPSVPENKVTPSKRTYRFDNQLLPIQRNNAKSFKINFIFKSEQNYEKNELYSFFENWYFNGLAGRLDKKLRHDYPLTYSSFIYNYDPKDIMLKVIDVTTTPEHANDCIYLTAKLLEELIKDGISEAEFYKFQKFVMANRERKTEIKMRDSYELFNSCIDKYNPFVKNFYQKLLNLTRDDINKYLHDLFANSKLTLGYTGDVQYADLCALLNEPFAILSDEKVREIDNPLYSVEEVLEMFNPNYKLRTFKELLKQTPYKPKLNKKQSNQVIKKYLDNKEEKIKDAEFELIKK